MTAAALFDTQKGAVIGIFHEHAHLGKGRAIHAAGQMEWLNCKVDDRSKVVGGAHRIETPAGYVITFSIESGLVYIHSIWVPSDADLQQYPHVFFTSPDIRDDSILDHGAMVLLLPFLRKFTKKLMILCSKILCSIHLGIFTKEWYISWTFPGIQALQSLASILSCLSPSDQLLR